MERLRSISKLRGAATSHCKIPRGLRQVSTALQRQPVLPLISILSASSRRVQNFKLSTHIRNESSTSGVKPLSSELKKTGLYDLHIANGAKMVPFAGYYMPVQYDSLSVGDSHAFTRTHASLFDVGHMCQHLLNGPGVNGLLERLTPADVVGLRPYTNTLSTFLWPHSGGIVDDTILTRLSPETFYVVTNAGTKDKFTEYFIKELELWNSEREQKVEWKPLTGNALTEPEGNGLIALQGPLSQEILQSLIHPGIKEDKYVDLSKLSFGESCRIFIKLQESDYTSSLLVSRGGYTGEDGFEISVGANEIEIVTKAILAAGPEKVQLAGLGARDSLRLEAGMCLYGHDIDDSTTPVEAGLSWIIGKDRRVAKDFYGAEVIVPQLATKAKGGTGVERRRVGLIVEGAPAREGADIVNENGEKIGNVTSGCPSPTLKQNIAMGYIRSGFHKAGTEVEVVIRGRRRKAKVTKMPFVPSKYYRVPTTPQE